MSVNMILPVKEPRNTYKAEEKNKDSISFYHFQAKLGLEYQHSVPLTKTKVDFNEHELINN